MRPLPLDGLQRKKRTPLVKPCLVVVSRRGVNIDVVATDTDTHQDFSTSMRLPSIAIVDPTAGHGFVERVVSFLKVERADDGTESLRLR